MEWYPQDKKELNSLLDKYIENDKKQDLNGIIVPHAGYKFSGEIAGKAYSMIPDKKKKAIILSPSHYAMFRGVSSIDNIETPLGEMKITKNKYSPGSYEHAIDNQIPFLQKTGIQEVLPLVIGEISENEIKDLAKEILEKIDEETLLVISTDLSHFYPYEKAKEIDKNTIENIKNPQSSRYQDIDACGKLPLLVLIEICKIKNWKPELITYQNSGDIFPETKDAVVGYAGFYF